MKVLIVNTYYNGGGAERVARSIYKGIVDKDTRVFFLAGRYQRRLPDDVEVVYYGLGIRLLTALTGWFLKGNLIYSYRSRKRIIKIIEEKSIDIVHFHNVHGNYLGLREISKISKVCPNIIVTMHDMWLLTGGCAHSIDCKKWIAEDCAYCDGNISMHPFRLSKAVYKEKKAVRNLDIRWVVPSKWLYNRCIEADMNPDRIRIIRNGISNDKYYIMDKASVRSKYGIEQDAHVLMFVSNGIRNVYKGYKYVEEAICGLKSGDEFAAIVVGGTEDIDLPISVYNYGYVHSDAKMCELYNAADVFILPSIADTLPYTPMEAMACGTPVIAFDTGGIPEIVNNETGWILSEKSGEAIKTCLEHIFAKGDMKEYQLKSEKGVYYINENYSEEKMLSNYFELYNEMMETNYE